MKLFVGLGNPGRAYARHRHNVGFMAAERIAARHDLGPWKKRFHGLVCEGPVGGHRVILLKPQTYMNDSGRAVGEVQRYLKIGEGDIYVFHDELDLAPGKVRIKTGGGNAGHNGLRSITAHIGNDYVRVRIGIGHPGAKEQVLRHVLSDFVKADAAWLEPLLDAIAAAAPRLAAGDDARFLTDVARAARPGEVALKPAATVTAPGPAPGPVPGRVPGRVPGPATAAVASPVNPPGGERRGKRASALAENLKRWLKRRREQS